MRKKITFNKSEKQYIQDNYLKKSSNKIGDHLGYRGGIIKNYMNRNNLIVPKKLSIQFRSDAMTGRTTFTAKEDNYIKDNYLTMPVKTMAKNIGRSGTGVFNRMRKLNLVVPKEIAEQRKKDNQYKTGFIPQNKGKKQTDYMSAEAIEKTKKTRFKKGSTPHNEKYNGHERITKDGYIEVRIEKAKYRLKHLHEWEKINGKLPKGYCLRSIDGTKQNTSPDNWELISRAENMKLNSIQRYPKQLIKIIRLNNKLKKQIQ